jgi:microcystin-dependent protein
MSEQYIAEIRVFGFNFAPVDWAQCNGQTLGIDQNSTLFNIIGTTYGGNGQTTFNLPNLQDRTAVGMGAGAGLMNWQLGEVFGQANHTLLITEVPLHSHQAYGGAGVAIPDETSAPASNSYPGRSTSHTYGPGPANTTLSGSTISQAGGNTPHNNIQPVQVLNYCIALYGVYPSQS